MMKAYWIYVSIFVVLIAILWIKYDESQKAALLMADTRNLSAQGVAERMKYVCDHLNDKSSKEIYMRVKNQASYYAKVKMPATFEEFKVLVKDRNDACENPRLYFHVKENSY